MALKTKPISQDVAAFLETVEPAKRKEDAYQLVQMMAEVSGEPAVMWGSSIIGFGRYQYQYASGHSGESMRIGFSPRKSALSLYIMSGFNGYQHLMQNLGKFKTGKSCLYVTRLENIDREILRQICIESLNYMREKYPA